MPADRKPTADDFAAIASKYGGVADVAPSDATPSSDPTDGMATWQRVLAGGVKAVRDAALGAQQIVPGFIAPGTNYAAALNADATQQAAQNKTLDAPLMDTTGGFAGNLIGDVALGAGMPGGGVAGLTKLATAGLGGMLQGALQPTTMDESRFLNMMVGGGFGAAGQQVANTLGAIARGAKVPDAARQAAQDFVDQFGGVLTRGQQTGSAFVQRMEKMLASLPGSGGFYRNAADANSGAITRAVDSVTGGDAGAMIQRAGAGKTFNVDQALVDEMQSIASKFGGVADRDAPNSALKTIEQYVGVPATPNPAIAGLPARAQAQAVAQGVPATVGGASGKLQPGATMPMVGPKDDFNNYQALRSLYGQRANTPMGDAADKAAYGSIQDAFDNAAMRSLSAQGTAPDAISAAHKAYAVQKIVQPARVLDTEGNVVGYDPAKLAARVAQVDKSKPGMIDALGDAGATLRQIANFATIATPVKSSGTAEGNIAGKVATLDVLKDLLSGEPITGALGMVGGMFAGPFGVNAALQGSRNGVPLLSKTPEWAASSLARIMRSASSALPLQTLAQ